MTVGSQRLFDFRGSVVVVTGGSRGLGRSMCEAFSSLGASVVVSSRKEDACVSLAEQLFVQTGNRALGVGCHVGKWDDCDRLVERVTEEFGGIDVLVNNAGIAPTFDRLSDVSEDLFDKTIAVNLKGAFRLSALVGERMALAEGGSIINVSSTASVEPRAHTVPYASAKAALNAMTIGMARSFGPTVRVNGIMPGMFFTDIAKSWDADAVSRRARDTIALQRVGEPDEVVGAALYLASDLATYTTGTIVKVDGGLAHGSA